MLNLSKPKIIGISFLALLIALATFDILTVNAYESAKLKRKELQQSCDRILQRNAECWSNSELCKAYDDAKVWFKNEYKEYPELACPNSRDPLVFGGEA